MTEYSIQQTSLEQIFNKFASNQGKKFEGFNDEDFLKRESKSIIIDDNLFVSIKILTQIKAKISSFVIPLVTYKYI